ncbi:MAG: type II toxin-antitoxin system HicB family antitoxin [Saprospiraceae bacterium]|nr:type II toxin-antitoxin system HicB family antitoxin [Saprospiraceae bacterium]
MSRKIELTAVIEKEDNMYIAFCPELDIASQGDTHDEAKANLVEALELFYETASKTEISKRLHNELQISRVTVNI